MRVWSHMEKEEVVTLDFTLPPCTPFSSYPVVLSLSSLLFYVIVLSLSQNYVLVNKRYAWFIFRQNRVRFLTKVMFTVYILRLSSLIIIEDIYQNAWRYDIVCFETFPSAAAHTIHHHSIKIMLYLKENM